MHHSASLFDAKELKPKLGLGVTKLPEIPDYAADLRRAGEMHFAIREHFDNQIFDSLGLNGFGDVGKNLGYVLAMLPDMLVGMFTGKSRNLKFGDNMMPIAAIFAGMFVKNPLLKMLLVGLGGANLLNKAGHEALENRDGVKPQPIRQYRKYDDESLDLRISQPVMKGNTLVATIDNIPSVITLNEDAVDAYYQGVLPLNTLANAVLRKYDEQQRSIQENYDRQMKVEERREKMIGIK